MRAARSAFESFVHLFKGGGVQGQSPCPRSAERGTLLCLFKRRRGSKGEPSPGVPPFIYASTCAPILWEVIFTLSCLSTPFLWCLPKETVSSRQRKALFYLGGSTIRVSAPASVIFTHLRPTLGGGGAGFWREARLKVSPAFSKAAGCRGGAPARAPLKRGTLFMLTKDQEGGLRGKPYQGVSPFYSSLVRVRRYFAAASVIITHLRPTWGGGW